MQGEVVLITGGSSGIGLAAARRFVSLGARVRLTARNGEKLARAAAELGGGTDWFSADVSDPASVAALMEWIAERDGRLDVLLNSAGQLDLASSGESAPELAERLMRVNYFGLTRTITAALPLLRMSSRKSIVNLSSFAGKLVPPYFSAYSASKFAVQGYTHALRQEMAGEGFHVGLVLPGPVASPMTDGLLNSPMYPVPVGVPVLSPDQVAAAIVKCVRRRRSEVVVPGYFAPLLRLGAAFPRLVDLIYLPYRKR
ncbi:MAG: SDR family oxidoreductase [Gemmatimonadota bacterium]|jgi:NAD(P)-dependent dehydrogenase (short-subunit alcohol dehydrogenase family)|nr:SDR family oxidoreductase [Gemmatimonadota bacterium]